MLQVRDGSAAAFEELVLRYQNRLIAVLDHLVRGRVQAEDLAQEVFLRVYRARHTYTPGAKFSTWLFTIANNVASNALRTMSRRKEVNVFGDRSTDTNAQTLESMAKAASGLMPTRQLDKAEMSEIQTICRCLSPAFLNYHIVRSSRGFQNGRNSSILGQRSITTFRPASSASLAARSS